VAPSLTTIKEGNNMTQQLIPQDAFHVLATLADKTRSIAALQVCAALFMAFRSYNDGICPEDVANCTCPEHGTWLRMDDYTKFTHEMDKLLHGHRAAKAPALCDILQSMRERGTSSDALDAARWRWFLPILQGGNDEAEAIHRMRQAVKFIEALHAQFPKAPPALAELNALVDKQRISSAN
jgi:hypothetical protein